MATVRPWVAFVPLAVMPSDLPQHFSQAQYAVNLNRPRYLPEELLPWDLEGSELPEDEGGFSDVFSGVFCAAPF